MSIGKIRFPKRRGVEVKIDTNKTFLPKTETRRTLVFFLLHVKIFGKPGLRNRTIELLRKYMRFCDHRPATGQSIQSDEYESIEQRLLYFLLVWEICTADNECRLYLNIVLCLLKVNKPK